MRPGPAVRAAFAKIPLDRKVTVEDNEEIRERALGAIALVFDKITVGKTYYAVCRDMIHFARKVGAIETKPASELLISLREAKKAKKG